MLSRLYRTVKRISDATDALATFLAVIVLVVMTVVITAQIVCRFFFSALSWSEELSRYLMVWLTFLGASMGIKRKAHIAVTFAVSSLPPKVQRWLSLVVYTLSLYFFVLVIIYGFKLMRFQAFQVSAGLGISMKYVYLSLPVGGMLCAVHIVSNILEVLGAGRWE
ncbi:MAG: TRAP transporter small permease [Deferribacteres bacterium]|nr:TRAP transporter small permease [Deferribacteres bacterium]